jgi:hypothetical protein
VEAAIEAAEGKATLEAQLADPANFTSAQKSAELEVATREVERPYARWQVLTA